MTQPPSPPKQRRRASAPTAPATPAVGKPRYMQVAQDLVDKVRSGEYRVGSKIPTEAELCGQYGVSRFTARQALQRLSDAGLVVRRPGMGTRVIAPPTKAAIRIASFRCRPCCSTRKRRRWISPSSAECHWIDVPPLS
ncbi:hypothetical protein CUR95_09075 [Bordetella bronchiseptica]|nr:hypothetical protein [Bordetella bronchiseptica]